jgi:hypothetical protein
LKNINEAFIFAAIFKSLIKIFMKKFISIFISLISLVAAVNGQSTYQSAIGARIGDGYADLFSASYKTFVSDQGAIELNLGFRSYGVPHYNWVDLSFSASYQYHFNIEAVEGLKWFIGGGLTAFNSFSSYSNYSGPGLGIFPTGGADYKFANIPLDLSADLRPTLAIIKPYSYYNTFYPGNIGISARYTFR